jgi:hypothetical protein
MHQLANTRVRTVWGQRERALVKARARFIASNPREGRVMRACRRALIAASGRPLKTRDLLQWAFPSGERQFWHYKSIYRAAPRYAVKVGRAWLPR